MLKNYQHMRDNALSDWTYWDYEFAGLNAELILCVVLNYQQTGESYPFPRDNNQSSKFLTELCKKLERKQIFYGA
jgi:hypothetical protein